MFTRKKATRVAVILSSAALLGGALAACSPGGGSESGTTTISMLSGGSDPVSTQAANDLAAAFEKANPAIKVKVETRPLGTEGDNLVKTRLSTGEMDDVFFYNSGSLFQALNPDSLLQPLTDEAWVKDLTDDFKKAVSTDDALYGAPNGTTFNGGILYNKKVYAELGLSVPNTWDEFISNSEKIKAAGIAPVLVSYGDTWTSQMFVLADFANVTAKDPGWAEDYTANKSSAKYSEEPALAGFTHTQEIFDKDLMNKDYASLTMVNALKMLATGEGAQYPMLTSVIANVIQSNPDQVNDIGYFAMPAESGDARATVWTATAAYIPKTTTGEKLEAAKKLVAFMNSPEGCELQYKLSPPGGPFATSACTLPDDVPALVNDVLAYQEQGKTGLALEFVSPVKGPNLEKILVQVGSGISSAQDGASLYDQDVKAQAQQLGIAGW